MGRPRNHRDERAEAAAFIRRCGAVCSECPFARDGLPHKPVLGEGPDDAIAIMVAESPGREEAERGRPLVGPTGQQFDSELLAVGLQRSRLFLINAVACIPPPGAKDSAMPRAIRACRPVFLAQLRRVFEAAGERHVFAMGKWAAFAMAGISKGVMNTRGFVRDYKLKDLFKELPDGCDGCDD